MSTNTERALIYVDSGCPSLSSLSSITSSSSSPTNCSIHTKGKGHSGGSPVTNNYVIKIQIGEEAFSRPVRIDVAGAHSHHPRQLLQHLPDGDSLSMLDSSGQSSPRSDMTPPPASSRLNTGPKGSLNPSLCRFGSETSESDTESDISAEYPHMHSNGHRPLHSSQNRDENMKLRSPGQQPRSPFSAASFARKEILGLGPELSETFAEKNFYYKSMEEPGRESSPYSEPPPSPSLSTLKESLNESLMKIFAEQQIGKRKSLPFPGSPRPDEENLEQNFKSIDLEGHVPHMGSVLPKSKSSLCKITEMDQNFEITIEEASFHLDEFKEDGDLEPSTGNSLESSDRDSLGNFAGYKDIFSRALSSGTKQIMSEKGTIRGVRNRVRDGIATFLQGTDHKNFNEKEQGRVVVYVTSMGVVRDTYQRCQKVKQILRNLLVKFDERDCYMNQAVQEEIRERIPMEQRKKELLKRHLDDRNGFQQPSLLTTEGLPGQTNIFSLISLPQVFIEGQYLGGAETIEKLNEAGKLRKILQPYKSVSVLNTCDGCGGFRMLPCPVCSGSKKSVHRNHFTEEFVALKCMHCDQAGLVKCPTCNP